MGVLFNYIFPYASYLDTAVGRRRAADLAKLLPQCAGDDHGHDLPVLLRHLRADPWRLAARQRVRLGHAQNGADAAAEPACASSPQNWPRCGSCWPSTRSRSSWRWPSAAWWSQSGNRRPVSWPGLFDLVRALGAGWLILAVWAMLGVLLGVLWRGTALAIGLGILYGLVIEGSSAASARALACCWIWRTPFSARTATRWLRGWAAKPRASAAPERSPAPSWRVAGAGGAARLPPRLRGDHRAGASASRCHLALAVCRRADPARLCSAAHRHQTIERHEL